MILSFFIINLTIYFGISKFGLDEMFVDFRLDDGGRKHFDTMLQIPCRDLEEYQNEYFEGVC